MKDKLSLELKYIIPRLMDLNEREIERNKLKNRIEKTINKILAIREIPPLNVGLAIKERLEQKILEILSVSAKESHKLETLEKDLNKKNYVYYNDKKIYLTMVEWLEVEKYKHNLICETMLRDKSLIHKSNLNIFDAKNISIQIDLLIKNTKILKDFNDIIKIDHVILKELTSILIKEHNKDLERYVLERKLSNKIIDCFEQSLTDIFYKTLDLSRMKILELISTEEINQKNNHILIIAAILKLLQILKKLNFEKLESKLAVIIKDIIKDKNITKILFNKILLNKLSYYKRIIGHEIVEILLTAKCIDQFSFNIKNRKKIFIKLLIPTILVNLATDIPHLIENHVSNPLDNHDTYSHLDNEFDINSKHQFRYDSFSKGIVSKKRKEELKYQYRCGYELDLINILDMLKELYKIFTLQSSSKNAFIESISNSENIAQIKFLSEFYKINFIKLKKILSQEKYEQLILNAINFTDIVQPTFKYSDKKKTTKKTFEENYFNNLINQIVGKKYIYYDIFLNISILLNFNSFYFNYFMDFRGRNYPLPTFSYLSPFVRNFISFVYDENINYNAFNATYKDEVHTEGIKLILEQLQSHFITYPKDNSKIESLYKSKSFIKNEDIFQFDIKLSSLYSVKKILRDLQGITFNIKNASFVSFYSLDSSSSGSQILALLLRDKSFAQGCSLNQTIENSNITDMYNTISSIIITEFDKIIIPTYNEIVKLLPPIKLQSITELVTDKEIDIYFKTLLIQIKKVSLSIDDIAQFLKELHKSFNYILTTTDTKLLQKYLLINFKKKQLNLITKYLQTYSTKYLYTDLQKLYTKVVLVELNPISEKEFIKIMTNYFVIKLFLIINKLTDIIKCYNKFGITKKLLKKPIMTYLYGSTQYGQQNQIMEVLITQSQQNGIYVNSLSFKEMSRYSLFLTKILKVSMNTLFPQSLALVNLITKYCKKKEFNIFKIDSKDIIYEYIPYVMKSIVKQKFINKAFRVNYRTTEINYDDISKCFTANYIQHHDALLTQYFIQNVMKLELNKIYNISVWTLHDRFGTHVFYCFLLKYLLLQSYKDLYNKNKFEFHFKDYPDILALRMDKDSVNYLNEDDINHPFFVKP